MDKVPFLRKALSLLTAFTMLVSVFAFPAAVLAEDSFDYDIRIDIIHHADFHGMVDNFMSGADPGAALMAAFAEFWRSQNPNRNNVVLVAGGDNFHGHPLSNILEGEPGVWIYNQMGIQYSSLGNHEFSFGSVDRARYFGENITLLAADLFIPGTNERPDFVQPYTIIQDGDAVVAIVGLMTSGMSHLISPSIYGQFDFRTPTIGVTWDTNEEELVFDSSFNQQHVDDIEALIEFLREEYNAGAVVALTHMGVRVNESGEADNLARLVNGFDAIIGGHYHIARTNHINGIPVAEAGHHGRHLGRVSIFFDAEGNMVGEIRSEMSGVGHSTNADLFNPYSIMNFNLHPAFQDENVQAIYQTVSEGVQRFWDDTPELYEVVGLRGTYGADESITDNTTLRDHRNQWASALVLDAVNRHTNDEDWSNTVLNDWIHVSNFGGWRNIGPFHWSPEDEVTVMDMVGMMPFDNLVVLLEIQGNDLITLMSMEASANAELDPPAFGLNGGQPVVVGGAFRGEQLEDVEIEGVLRPRFEWFFNNGEQINDDETIYRIVGSNFIFGGFNANGGDRFPFPGNNHGNALGMTVVSEPVALHVDGRLIPWSEIPADSSTWPVYGLMNLREAMIETLGVRLENGFQDFVTLPYEFGEEEYQTAVTLPYEFDEDELENLLSNVEEIAPEVVVPEVVETYEITTRPVGTAIVVNAWMVNVREEARTDSRAISALNRDAVVIVLEGPVHGWYRVQFGEVTGWVFQNFLDVA